MPNWNNHARKTSIAEGGRLLKSKKGEKAQIYYKSRSIDIAAKLRVLFFVGERKW
jgi:hypothetical protein